MTTAGLTPVLAAPAEPRVVAAGSSTARFLELRGCRVFEALGATWGHYRGPFYCSLPFHQEFSFGRSEIRSMMLRENVASIRFPTTTRPGLAGGLYVCDPHRYSLADISRQYRVQIRRGMEICTTRLIDPDELLAQGLPLNLDTMQRQRRFDPEFGDPARWRRFVEALRNCPHTALYGAFIGDRLSAYIVGIHDGGWLHLLYKMSSNQDRALPVSHALDYFVIQGAAADPGVRMIGNSFVSVRANDGLDQYKRKMGFSIAPHNIALHLHPALAPLALNPVTRRAVRKVWDSRPQSSRWELAARLLEGAHTTMSTSTAVVTPPPDRLDACQHTGCFQYARLSRPYVMFVARRAWQRLRREGVGSAIRKLSGLAAGLIPSQAPAKARLAAPPAAAEALNLQPGDLVRIRTLDEVRATLDAAGKHRGMAFVATEMEQHCGRTYRVYKRVEKIFLEESKQNRKLRNTVLLDGVQCQGIGLDCDRSCYLFWREVWLQKIENTESQ